LPVNDSLGLRLAVQKSEMTGGWITNSAVGDDLYTTTDGFTGDSNSFNNPRATDIWPQEETLYARLTAAGDISDRFSYNVKGSFGRYERASPSGASELFDCSTLNGVAHESIPAPVQPPDRPSTLFIPDPRPSVDCQFDGAAGWNNVPPEVAAVNPRFNEFGDGRLGEIFESYGLTTTLDWTLDAFNVQAILNYHDQDNRWVGDQDGGAVTSIFVGEQNTFKNYSAEVRAVTKFDQPVNFVFGAYLQDTARFFDQRVGFGRVQWTGPLNDPADEFTAYRKLSETDGNTLSVYGELIWDINERWQLTAGARYIDEEKDSFFYQPYVAPYSFFPVFFKEFDPNDPTSQVLANQSFDDVIPEVTLRWEPNDRYTFYAAYKEGFKSGGFSNSSILSNLLTPVVDANGGILFEEFVFDPETNKGGEIGVKASLLNNSLLAAFEVFYYDFTDLQVNFLNSQQFAYVTENAGGSETSGAELQLDWATPVDGLTMSGSLGYLKSEFTDFEAFCFTGQTPAQGCGPLLPGQSETDLRQNLAGNTRPRAPKWSGFVAANYERPVGTSLIFGATANLQFKGETVLNDADPNATQSAYETVDVNLRLGRQDGKWEVALIGKNLTDKLAFRTAGNVAGTGGNTGTPEGFRGDLTGTSIRPRQYELQVTYRY
jgi:outer membrane receptor protein involved in Fe transport